MTTCPPRTACATTPPTAITPNQRSQERFSFVQTKKARMSVKIPRPNATTRWENSKSPPPLSISAGGIQLPWDFGQSGTESAASVEVTKAPATKRRTVQQTTKIAYLLDRPPFRGGGFGNLNG